jgi:hypothetical protein
VDTIGIQTHEPNVLATSGSACFGQAAITVWKKINIETIILLSVYLF